MSVYRATSPRRDIREAKVFSTTGATEMAPVDTPIHPDSAHNRANQQQTPKGPAYAQSIYERRLERSRSPFVSGGNVASSSMHPSAAASTPPVRTNVAGFHAANSYHTPARGTSNAPVGGGATNLNFSTAGTTGGVNTPSQTILADQQLRSRVDPCAVSGMAAVVSTPLRGHYGGQNTSAAAPNANTAAPSAYFYSTVNTPATSATTPAGALTTGGVAGAAEGSSAAYTRDLSLSLTAPDKAMLELLLSEAQDRHFIEKLFVAQEEKHERNQWILIEAHRRRMLQMNYAAPLRIARMEATQEHRVGNLIAEYEVGEEITEQRRKMDERVAELRNVIANTNRYRDALETLESDHKAKYEHDMAVLEEERRAKKRLIDELKRQYEFASVHNRSDDLYSGAFGLRAGLDFQLSRGKRDPDYLKSPNVTGPRAVETVAEQGSTTALAIHRHLASPASFPFIPAPHIGEGPSSQGSAISPAVSAFTGDSLTNGINSSRYGNAGGTSRGSAGEGVTAYGTYSIGQAVDKQDSANYHVANASTHQQDFSHLNNTSGVAHQHNERARSSGLVGSAVPAQQSAPITNYSVMTNFGLYPDQHHSPSAQQSHPIPAAPLQEPGAGPRGGGGETIKNSSNSAANDIILQSQRALQRAEELERSANSRQTRY